MCALIKSGTRVVDGTQFPTFLYEVDADGFLMSDTNDPFDGLFKGRPFLTVYSCTLCPPPAELPSGR